MNSHCYKLAFIKWNGQSWKKSAWCHYCRKRNFREAEYVQSFRFSSNQKLQKPFPKLAAIHCFSDPFMINANWKHCGQENINVSTQLIVVKYPFYYVTFLNNNLFIKTEVGLVFTWRYTKRKTRKIEARPCRSFWKRCHRSLHSRQYDKHICGKTIGTYREKIRGLQRWRALCSEGEIANATLLAFVFACFLLAEKRSRVFLCWKDAKQKINMEVISMV